MVLVAAFVAALYGFTMVKQSFFPPATRPQFMVDIFLPAGTHVRETEALAGAVREGAALRQLLARCGHCGRRLHTHYRGRNAAPGYHSLWRSVSVSAREYA